MTSEQAQRYQAMQARLTDELKQALRRGDTTLLGVVLNVLLAWSSTCFREEVVKHPRTRELLFYTGAVFDEADVMPAEAELLRICQENKARGRRVLAYSVYTGRRDTTARLKAMLERNGLKVAVLRASVETSKREDWILDQVDRGIDVLITNPELVKTGLDLLDFPTICFLQTGYNVYTLQQASRRSWRIGQQQDVEVFYLGYAETAQIACLELMAKKIAVSQSTSGELPDSGLDILNQDGDSIEVALAKQLMAA
jgi:SNF2 family DNA or RNA helicase